MKKTIGGYDEKIKCTHCGNIGLMLREIVKASEKEISVKILGIGLSRKNLDYEAFYYCKDCKRISSYPL